MALVEAVAFHKLDRRLAAALLGRGTVVALTHQQLADELGSVREIVTRVLRELRRPGLGAVGPRLDRGARCGGPAAGGRGRLTDAPVT
ncbi:MAG: helix-turn-helix domain-containing protein [Comamonadaceae bacterium]|nr:helix-turn-helix domain-containing protein [Comamonadaceae bacterium]